MSRISSIARNSAPPLFLMTTIVTQAFALEWPVEPGDSEHPIGNSHGEFQQDTGFGPRNHPGIDILATPKIREDGSEDPSAPWVQITDGGTVMGLSNDEGSRNNGTSIETPAGLWYRYWHLEYNSYHVDFVENYLNGIAVDAGSRVAKIHHFPLDFHHLHYDVRRDDNYLNPLADITPNPDPDIPLIQALGFARDNSDPWIAFDSVAPGACTVVSGNTDIIVQARDRDDAGSALVGASTLWTYDLHWRACPDTSSDCPWQSTYAFDAMPSSWATEGSAASSAQFSDRVPWDSEMDYTAATWIYGIVTNFVDGAPNTAGTWDTTSLVDGSYSVGVQATDFAGNTSIYTARACVQNATDCTTELVVRDAVGDNGAIPYTGENWWVSPDITANPGTPDEDRNILMSATNPVQVRIWNYSSCALPEGTTYDVCLGWGLPSSLIPYPLPSDQVVECRSETVPPGGWPVGTSLTTTFIWEPEADSLPLGHHCLIAWVDSPQDSVLDTPAVNWDDNRAQQNITFGNAPELGETAYRRFWMYPQKGIQQRSLELSFSANDPRPLLRDIRLHVAAGVQIERIIGGQVIGGYSADKPSNPCDLKPGKPCRDPCESWKQASQQGCTRIIGGIDPTGRLRLEGVRIERPVPLTLEVQTDDKVAPGQFADVYVKEHGRLSGQQKPSSLGGLTLRFEHKVSTGNTSQPK